MQATDAATGMHYYFDKKTKETRWSRPVDAPCAATEAAGGAAEAGVAETTEATEATEVAGAGPETRESEAPDGLPDGLSDGLASLSIVETLHLPAAALAARAAEAAQLHEGKQGAAGAASAGGDKENRAQRSPLRASPLRAPRRSPLASPAAAVAAAAAEAGAPAPAPSPAGSDGAASQPASPQPASPPAAPPPPPPPPAAAPPTGAATGAAMGAPAAVRKGKAGGGRAPKAGKRPGFVAFSRDAARSDDEGDAGSDMDGWIAKSDAEMSDDDDGAPFSGSF